MRGIYQKRACRARNARSRTPDQAPTAVSSPGMRWLVLVACLLTAAPVLTAVKIDLTPHDVERALVIARGREPERERFHAPYVQRVETPFVERVEVVSEFRRIVMLAEDRISRGDRQFAYSVTAASEALQVWRRRVSLVARVRFHPQNNYVGVPAVTITMVGDQNALIGVKREPLLAPASSAGQAHTVLGAIIEAVFEAAALAQSPRDFIITLDGKDLGRFTVDFGALE